MESFSPSIGEWAPQHHSQHNYSFNPTTFGKTSSGVTGQTPSTATYNPPRERRDLDRALTATPRRMPTTDGNHRRTGRAPLLHGDS